MKQKGVVDASEMMMMKGRGAVSTMRSRGIDCWKRDCSLVVRLIVVVGFFCSSLAALPIPDHRTFS